MMLDTPVGNKGLVNGVTSSQGIESAVSTSSSPSSVDGDNNRVTMPLMDEQPPTIVLVGSGMAGSMLALELAGKGYKVIVLEKRALPLSGSSDATAWRLPLGLHFPEPETSGKSLIRTLNFLKEYSDYVVKTPGKSVEEDPLRHGHYFLMASGEGVDPSMQSTKTLKEFYDNLLFLDKEYEKWRQDSEYENVPLDKKLYKKLQYQEIKKLEKDGIVDPTFVDSGYKTAEAVFAWDKFQAHIRKEISEHPNIKLITEANVFRVAQADVEKSEKAYEIFYKQEGGCPFSQFSERDFDILLEAIQGDLTLQSALKNKINLLQDANGQYVLNERAAAGQYVFQGDESTTIDALIRKIKYQFTVEFFTPAEINELESFLKKSQEVRVSELAKKLITSTHLSSSSISCDSLVLCAWEGNERFRDQLRSTKQEKYKLCSRREIKNSILEVEKIYFEMRGEAIFYVHKSMGDELVFQSDMLPEEVYAHFKNYVKGEDFENIPDDVRNAVVKAIAEAAAVAKTTKGVQKERLIDNRLKISVRVEIPEDLWEMSSLFFCFGPHYSFTNCGNGTGILTYEPVTNVTHSSFITPAMENMLYHGADNTMDEETKQKITEMKEALGKQIIEGAVRYHPVAQRFHIIETRVGNVITFGGSIDITSSTSVHHRRTESGVEDGVGSNKFYNGEEGFQVVIDNCIKLLNGKENAEETTKMTSHSFSLEEKVRKLIRETGGKYGSESKEICRIEKIILSTVRRRYTNNSLKKALNDNNKPLETKIDRIFSSIKDRRERDRISYSDLELKLQKKTLLENYIEDVFFKPTISPFKPQVSVEIFKTKKYINERIRRAKANPSSFFSSVEGEKLTDADIDRSHLLQPSLCKSRTSSE